jgi:hypothetical protein
MGMSVNDNCDPDKYLAQTRDLMKVQLKILKKLAPKPRKRQTNS